jgi:hypothetical protein
MKNSIKNTSLTLAILVTFFTVNAFGQDHAHGKKQSPSVKSIWQDIFSKSLTDSGLVNKKMKISEFTLAPGHTDTISQSAWSGDIYLCC